MSEITITDQQVSRRSKVPLKVLRQHPEYMEGYRKVLQMMDQGKSEMKSAVTFVHSAKFDLSEEDSHEVDLLSKRASENFRSARELLERLKRPDIQ